MSTATAAPWCKVISGIGGTQLERVRRLCALYAAAGARYVDVAGEPAVVRAGLQGLEDAGAFAGPHACELMFSVGLGGDPHVGAALLDTSVCATCPGCTIEPLRLCAERPLAVRAPECPACMRCIGACPYGAITLAQPPPAPLDQIATCQQAGAAALEIHVGAAPLPELAEILRGLRRLPVPLRAVSLSLGPPAHDAQSAVQVAELARAELDVPWWLQAEGDPMRGAGPDGHGDAASLDLLAAIAALAPWVPVQLAGGAGPQSRERCRQRGLQVVGVGFGTVARHAVAPALDAKIFDWQSAATQSALHAARALVAAAG